MPRSYTHDYHSRCIYHITLKKASGALRFGELCGELPNAGIARSQLGSIIEKHLRQLSLIDPAIRLLQYCIMPDHVHLLVFITTPTSLHLGNYIGKLKVLIYQDYRSLTGTGQTIFDNDFYDCILHPGRSLDTIYRYIRDNPRRLAIRRAHPDYFRRMNALSIGGNTYRAYGNVQLLEHPFKEQVIVHRADSPVVRKQNLDLWLYTAANGGILVSPFISPAEKEIRTAAEAAGGRIILITREPMGERYKPSGHDFDMCEAGRMLIISAGISGELSRQSCMAMNVMARTLADNPHTTLTDKLH